MTELGGWTHRWSRASSYPPVDGTEDMLYVDAQSPGETLSHGEVMEWVGHEDTEVEP